MAAKAEQRPHASGNRLHLGHCCRSQLALPATGVGRKLPKTKLRAAQDAIGKPEQIDVSVHQPAFMLSMLFLGTSCIQPAYLGFVSRLL